MERTKAPVGNPTKLPVKEVTAVQEEVRPKLMYKKMGGGSLRMTLEGKKRIIKPNETFAAYPEDIPVGFKNLIVCLDTPEIQKKASIPPPVIPKEALFGMEKNPNGGWDVVNNETLKPMNTEPLKKAAAQELLDSLNG